MPRGGTGTSARRPPLGWALLGLPALCAGWNSATTLDRFYSFQEFYTDAQYGPDFGYYSTGRILHADGPIENGVEGDTGSQEWFNSYTTLPMSLSPYFGQMLGDRLAGMWAAMGKVTPVFIVEFGGGTGMLARDVLRHCRQSQPEFYAAVTRYVIGERSQALRSAQMRTAAEFHRSGKLVVTEADARQASKLRELLAREAGGPEAAIRGFILSNELLDEFDPLRLRLVWRAGQPPDAAGCESCSAYREAHVLHRVDESALGALLQKSGSAPGEAERLVDAHRWEGKVLACGLLEGPLLQRLLSEVSERLLADERRACSPMQVCCSPFVLAVNKVLMIDHPSLQHVRPHRWVALITEVLRRYREELGLTNGTVPLSKERYRELRRMAARLGPEAEKSLLVGGSALPGRVHSEEVFFGLSAARCQELRGWRERNAERLAVSAAVRDRVAPMYDRAGATMGVEHLKLVVRPGEAEFVYEAGLLLDDGFMVTMDYGADGEALVWQALSHPNFEGIHTMDARAELAADCTEVSYLECPGLQDITTSIDFTEVAEAGRRLGGWEVAAYGPLFLLELAFGDQSLSEPVPHLIERAGGARTVGLHAWYRKAEGDPWASFKVLVQRRGNSGSWALGPPGLSWPLEASPRLSRPPSDCWGLDLSKPPLAAAVTRAAAAVRAGPAGAVRGSAPGPGAEEEVRALAEAFGTVLKGGIHLDQEHAAQKQAYREMHLALMLADYWLHLARLVGPERCANPGEDERAHWLSEVRSLAATRRLPELHGEAMFDQVMAALEQRALGNSTPPGPGAEPFVCAAAELVRHTCAAAATMAEVEV